ncbi:M16 family metallopeptidase [Galbibacter mesophilus]|uniref:M16 family metallopeptidase n=1 Tax=Galbibacter mesophilus TaxID=379069 RepID=UPI001920057B|nr:pitrilysin family protein [Galbibacter mesophilus]MCM5661892.1 insulinase family protein [Galbibacter mesophilus]
MVKTVLSFVLAIALAAISFAQEIKFQEYDLANGVHVILHQDNTAPVVTTSVMYHVGSKDEKPNRTGFAHFFEHLLFEGTKNIERGEWFKIVSSNGGSNNANTTTDRTYYYEVFPSNKLELGLWMESERLMHPIINEIGVETQNEVVKEEKRQRIDNSPYGGLIYGTAIQPYLFKKHPYRWSVIGSMEDLDAATLQEFKEFNHKYYVPNNAVLVVAGDIDIKETEKMIKDYFGPIPKGEPITRNFPKEEPITQEIKATEYDSNIQIPALALAYRTPAMTEKDAYVLNMISTYLSDGKTSKLYKKMVDENKSALQVFAFNRAQEDYSMYNIFALPLGDVPLQQLETEIDEEIKKLQTTLISDKDYQKLQNKMENDFVNSNASIEGIANSLARYYMLYGDTNLINSEIEIYRNISREDIKRVANKYLNKNQRLRVEYLPKSTEEK